MPGGEGKGRERGGKDGDQQATAATNAFDKIDEGGNGYVNFDELHGLAERLGLPLSSSQDFDDAIAALDEDNDGILDRQKWVRWWVKRCGGNPTPEKQQEVAARNAFKTFRASKNAYDDDAATLDRSAIVSVCEQLGLGSLPNHILTNNDGSLDRGIAESLGLHVDGSVVEREQFVRWWVHETTSAVPALKITENHDIKNHDGANSGSNGAPGSSSSIRNLTALARQGRQRASTNIHTAAWRGDFALVKSFLEHEPDLANAADVSEFGTGYRPMHYAAYGGFLDVCEALRAAGGRALAAAENGVTALFLASQAGKTDVVRFLLDLGADPTICETESGLCAADVGQDYPEILDMIVKKGSFEIPPAVEESPVVSRVGNSSFQVTFSPLSVTKRQLPISRYKLKVDLQPPQIPLAPCPPKEKGVSLAKAGADDHTYGRLAKLVLVPAGGIHRWCDGGKPFVTIGGLQPGSRYTVQVAAVNAMGFGPYGPPSEMVCTKQAQAGSVSNQKQEFERRGARRGENAALASSSKGKGRQVLARERRRRMAEAAEIPRQQQRQVAEEVQARRAAKMAGLSSSTRSLAFLNNPARTGTSPPSKIRDTTGDRTTVKDVGSKPQPLPALHRNRRTIGHFSKRTTKKGTGEHNTEINYDDLSESSVNDGNSDDNNIDDNDDNIVFPQELENADKFKVVTAAGGDYSTKTGPLKTAPTARGAAGVAMRRPCDKQLGARIESVPGRSRPHSGPALAAASVGGNIRDHPLSSSSRRDRRIASAPSNQAGQSVGAIPRSEPIYKAYSREPFTVKQRGGSGNTREHQTSSTHGVFNGNYNHPASGYSAFNTYPGRGLSNQYPQDGGGARADGGRSTIRATIKSGERRRRCQVRGGKCGRGGEIESDVEVSSCGDMSISSAEDDGDMIYQYGV